MIRGLAVCNIVFVSILCVIIVLYVIGFVVLQFLEIFDTKTDLMLDMYNFIIMHKVYLILPAAVFGIASITTSSIIVARTPIEIKKK